MTPEKTKRQIREELDRATAQYLDCGGRIDQVPPGVSGRDEKAPLPPVFNAGKASEQRTPVPEVVAAVEARRQAPPSLRKGARRGGKAPKRELILDDFGQPLRWEWVDQ